jgi:hypothetical protein
MIPALVALIVGLGLGAACAWFLARRGPAPPQLQPVGRGEPFSFPPELPSFDAGQTLWLVPEERHQRDVVEALARALARDRGVVLAPRAGSRAVLVQRLADQRQVLWLDEDRPTCERLILAAEALQAFGPVVLLVEGGEALEAPAPDEPSDAVVQELLELSELPTVVLLAELDRLPARPALRLRAAEAGLVTDDGALVIRCDEARSSVVEPEPA